MTGADGRKAIEAINAVYLSAYLKQKIRLPLEITADLERIFVEMKALSPRASQRATSASGPAGAQKQGLGGLSCPHHHRRR